MQGGRAWACRGRCCGTTSPRSPRALLHSSPPIPSPPQPRMTIYNFVWDRFRAIYKELDTQGLKGPRGVRLIEQHVRFMLVLHHGE